MLIPQSEIISIRENKATLVKNFISLKINYDFNLLSQLLEKNDLPIFVKSTIGNMRDVFQIRKVANLLEEIKPTLNFLGDLFFYEKKENDGIDLFFSFVSQAGVPHWDEEDVFILGLQGEVMYKIFGIETKNYIVKKGDMIFIPKGLKHKVIALSPRIVASVGFWGNKKNV